MFDDSFLHQINFEGANLEKILRWNPGVYDAPVRMAIDGQVVESIYLRRKGFTSNEFNEVNPPLKIDIDHFIADQDYDGIDKFNLHNHHMDEYYQRNALAYALYRRAGVAAPRTSFAEVYVNGDFVDLYTITEDIDKTFLRQHFASNRGNLYKGREYPYNSVNVQEGTIDSYNDFVNNVDASNFETFIDVHNFFRVMAVDLIIKDSDAYATGSHNYYMYQEPKSDKLHLITWDHNFAFSFNPLFQSFLQTLRPPMGEIIAHPAVKPAYLETVCDLLSYLLDEAYIENLAYHNYDILTSNTNQVSVPLPDPIIELISAQRQWFRDALAQEGYSDCDGIALPINAGDVVINEFVAQSDKHGQQEPNGGTPDWIELYNNTDSHISLGQRYYLSDDKDFLKKWHFAAHTIIPANDYLILWADRDIHQEGIHANFKLKSSAGDLFLTYEDLTVLDQVSYGRQELNLGYARTPNGTGDFRIQAPTFKANNGNP